jgi:hypothetical protein
LDDGQNDGLFVGTTNKWWKSLCDGDAHLKELTELTELTRMTADCELFSINIVHRPVTL